MKKVLPIHPPSWPEIAVPISEPWFGTECDRNFSQLQITDVHRLITSTYYDDYRFVVHAQRHDLESALEFVCLSTFDPRFLVLEGETRARATVDREVPVERGRR